MKRLADPAAASEARLAAAARALEAMLVKQIVTTSGAFRGGEGPGAGIRADQFADTLADAVAQSGSLGIADAIVHSLAPAGAAAAVVPAPAPAAPAPARARGVSNDPAPAAVAPADPAAVALPLRGKVTSRFGLRTDPFTGAPRVHDGVDVGAPAGSAIRASAAGVVVRAGPRGGYGNAVEIDHGGGVVTLYGHASQLLVSPGERVDAGQAIARVGSTGRSTGPHLHFEVRVEGHPVDPAKALKVYASRADPAAGAVPDRRRMP